MIGRALDDRLWAILIAIVAVSALFPYDQDCFQTMTEALSSQLANARARPAVAGA